MKIKNFIKMNKSIIITFLVFEVVLYGAFYLGLKSEMKGVEYRDYSEVDINSRKALEIVKDEHENANGDIKEIKYTHDYETYNGKFYAIVKTYNEEYYIYEVYEISENIICRFLVAMNSGHSMPYETWTNLSFDSPNCYDIYHDYLESVSEWKVAEMD